MWKIDTPSVHVLHFSGSSVFRYFYGTVTFIIFESEPQVKKVYSG